MLKINTNHEFDTEYYADSVEWCPISNYEEYLVCGTYQLNDNIKENNIKRKGRIYLFKYDLVGDKLVKLFVVETVGVLDQKWYKGPAATPLLGVANAIGEIVIYKLDDENLIEIDKISLLNDCNQELITLSLDWCLYERKILAGDSLGNISLIEMGDSGMANLLHWKAHDFEAWACLFDDINPNIVYTGGDDTFLNVYDTRTNDSNEIKLKNKSHMGGVTALLNYNNNTNNYLISGSYDDRIRLFDKRYLNIEIGNLNLNGGVWRIKTKPNNNNLLLTACMYDKFNIIKLNNNDKQNDDSIDIFKLIGYYDKHSSICYGSDWCYKIFNNMQYFAVCSFYDHKLSICSIVD